MAEKVGQLRDKKNASGALNNLIDIFMAGQSNSLEDFLMELQNVAIAQGGLSKLAKATGLGRENLYKMLSPQGSPKLITFLQVVRALGFDIIFEERTRKLDNLFSKTALIDFSEEKKLPCKNCVAENKNLLEQWHETKNMPLSPHDVSGGSHMRVWWRCSKGVDHEWVASVIKMANGAGCPICSGKKVVESNSLLSTHAELVKNGWDFDKNLKWQPYEVAANSSKKVWWKCEKKHEWEDSIRNRVLGKKCSYCGGL